MKEIKFALPNVNETIIDVGDDESGENVFSIVMTKGWITDGLAISVIPKSDGSRVVGEEIVDGERFLCQLYDKNNNVTYLKIDVTDGGWLFDIW